jgi:urea transport system substrate-binding protein
MKHSYWRALVAFVLVVAALLVWLFKPTPAAPIKLGVVHALTGTMATSEAPLVEALAFAVDEINRRGGVLGRPLALVVADTRSDDEYAAQQAQWLIEEQGVAALFGCWTSACRRAVKPVVEAHDHVLFYPLQYEGMETSANIIYTGLAPNQQVVPAVRWGMERFGPRVLLVGSDYVFPRVANVIIADLVRINGGEIVAEHYLPLGAGDVSQVVDDIQQRQPALILNTLNGDSNQAFIDALVAQGLGDVPMVSFSVAEPEMVAWSGGRLTRHFGVWSFFQSLDDARTRDFVKRSDGGELSWRAALGTLSGV